MKPSTQPPGFDTSVSTVTPLVSVIIPAYNAERFILSALSSIDDQKYSPLEILLIDDGSTDKTAELVQRNAPHVRIIKQSNGGASAARNTGLREASGEFICFLDADDFWFPGKLAAQTAYLTAHPDVGIVYHEWHVWRPDAAGIFNQPTAPLSNVISQSIIPDLSGWIYHRLLMDCEVHTSTVMMRRSVAKDIGFFDTGLVTGEDYDYWLRASRRCKIDKLSAIFSLYRISPDGLTSKPSENNNEYEVINRSIRRWGLTSPDGSAVEKTVIKRRLANLAFAYGYLHYHHGSPELARNAFWVTLRHDPFRWKALAYLTAVAGRSLFDWCKPT